MTSRDFCFWLQGFFELQKPETISKEQSELIRRHLNLVFKHEIDPSMPDPTGELQAVHDGAVSSPFPAPSATGTPSVLQHPLPMVSGDTRLRC